MKTKVFFPLVVVVIATATVFSIESCKKDNNDDDNNNGGVGGVPCPDIPTVEYAGQTYHTLLIGDQCWLKENLNIGTRIPGEDEMQDNGTIEKYCYDDDETNCDKYGGLYQWNEMMQYVTSEGAQGICPPGWHIPTDVEWCTLTTYIDSTVNCNITGYTGTDAGYKMKSTSGWYSNNNGSDTYGFKALPGGYRSYGGYSYYIFIEESAFFWSSIELDSNRVWKRNVAYHNYKVRRSSYYKEGGFSVRCVKN